MTNLEARVRAAYHRLASEPTGWVSLTRLRAALPDLSRQQVDQALDALLRDPKVHLVPESNQKALTQADRAAAFRIGDQDKHLLAIDR